MMTSPTRFQIGESFNIGLGECPAIMLVTRAKRVSEQYKGDRQGGDPQMNLEAATF